MTDNHNLLSPEEAAARWYARLNAGEDQSERRQFILWLNQQPKHRLAWDALQQTLTRIDAEKDQPAIAAMRAAALAARPEQQAEKPANPNDPRSLRWGSHWAVAASLALFAGFCGYALWPVSAPKDEQASPAFARYATLTGERKTLTLPDGSSIILDTNSEIQLPQKWDGQRLVTLVRGQAMFTVAKNPDMPFIVLNRDRSVEALGTRFTTRDDDRRFSVALLEGRVKVNIPTANQSSTERQQPESALLSAGDTLVADGDIVSINQGEAEKLAGWVSNRLNFDEIPLSEIVSEMNRYSDRKIRLADPVLGKRVFSGTFSTDGIDSLVQALEAYNIGRVARSDEREIIIVSE